MEWGKVKTILIVSFLCLNLLLGAQLWDNRLKDFPLIPDEAAEQVAELLREKGITLRHEIPKETPNVREISIEFQIQNGKRTELVEPVSILQSEARWRDRLKEYIPEIQEYAIDRTRSNERTIVLNQTFGGIPMFQVDLLLHVKDDRITAFNQSYAEVQPFRDQKEVAALSALRVLEVMAETKLKEGSVIEDMRLGYHGQLFDSDTQVLAPKWRITLENGDVYYVHAISGEME